MKGGAALIRTGTSDAGRDDNVPVSHDTIKSCMPRARAMARSYRGRGVDLDELTAVAYTALCEAGSRFDEERHPTSAFWGYASRWVHGRLIAAIRKAPICPLAPAATPVEDYVVMTATDGDEAIRRAEGALARCSPIGRALLEMTALEGYTVRRAASALGLGLAEAKAEHDAACLEVAATAREEGWALEASA
jgi:RNA polymerase sigma factor (sigma-70 family)